MGAAMAAISATEVVYSDMFMKQQIKIVTFGEPRVGNQQFANTFDDMVESFLPKFQMIITIEYKFRVTHHRDLVAHMPPKIFSYQHHRYEVWYKNEMTSDSDAPVICEAQEDSNCSNSYFVPLSFYDHEHYFGNNFRNYIGDSCK
uniref:Lipase_3 domain-containing protein n=1 Tax=Syphacia muris TaxID=451379 RepID=A0A0N5ART4_9BILA